MNGTEAGRQAIAEEFTLLVERAMDQMEFIQPLKDMIKRSKEHEIKVNDRLLKLENETKELKQCLRPGDLPKEEIKHDSQLIGIGDVFVIKNSDTNKIFIACRGRNGNTAIKKIPGNQYYNPKDIIWTNVERIGHIDLGDLSI